MSNIFIEPMGLSGVGGLQPQPISPQTSGSNKLMAGSVVTELSPEGGVLPESFSLALADPTIATKAGRNDLLPNEALLNAAPVEVSAEQSTEGLMLPSDVLTTNRHRREDSAEPRTLFTEGVAEGTALALEGGGDVAVAMIPELAENTIATGTVDIDSTRVEDTTPLMIGSTGPLSWRPSVLNGNNAEVAIPVEGENVSVGESGNTLTPFLPQQPSPRGLTPQTKITEVEPAMQGAVTSVLAAAINNKSAATLDTANAAQSGDLARESNGSILAKMSGANTPMQPLVKNMTQESFGVDLASVNVAEPADEVIDVKPSTTPTAVHEKLTASTHNAEAKVVVQANVRVGMPGWADQIAERTANLVSQNIKQAEIQLNPQEMGSINVKISVTQEQAAVTFTVANGVVREALDQTLQRLRENFESEGMDLVQADVRDEQQAQGEEGAEGGSFSDDADISEDAEGDEVMTVSVEPSGVDHFV